MIRREAAQGFLFCLRKWIFFFVVDENPCEIKSGETLKIGGQL